MLFANEKEARRGACLLIQYKLSLDLVDCFT